MKWDDGLVAKALNLLQANEPPQVARKLGISYGSLRRALYRRGIRVKDFFIQRAKTRRQRVRALVKPSANPNRPFNAMAAFEHDPGGCRFPLGDLDQGTFRFCGRDTNRTYCATHRGKVYLRDSGHWTHEQYERWLLKEINQHSKTTYYGDKIEQAAVKGY